nr:hypothetical protein [Spirosomataceae bacterium]
TNLIPAVQFQEVKKVVVVESKHAKTRGWARGMISMLNSKNIQTDTIDLTIPNDDAGGDIQLEWVIQKINKYVEEQIDINETVYWNIGGGLKPMMLAMYQCFYKRNSPSDRICYLNPPNNFKVPTIEIIHNQKGVLITEQLNTDVNLSADEILLSYNQKIQSAKLFYHHKKQLSAIKFNDLFAYNEFRAYAFTHTSNTMIDTTERFSLDDISELLKSKSRSDFIVESIEKHLKDGFLKTAISENELKIASELKKTNKPLSLATFIHTTKLNNLATAIKSLVFKKPGDVHLSLLSKFLNFEENEEFININDPDLALKLNSQNIKLDNTLLKSLGYTKTASYFEGLLEYRFYEFLSNNNHNIIEAYSNVKISSESSDTFAEYDILLITKQGNAIAIEAKTFDFIQKDNDARQFNLERATSKFGEMFVVFPYDPQDFDKPYFAQKLAELPFKLNDRKKQFFVIADSVKSNNFRVNFTDKKLQRVEKDGLLINCLESFFGRLKV